MITAMIVIFVIGYVLIACEHPIKVNKATFALIMCATLWTLYATLSGDNAHEVHESVLYQLSDTCEILFFLIGAMTIVEIIDRYGGFNFITDHVRVKSKVHLMWVLSVLAFFMSAVLDNMTTTIIMVMMLRRLLSDKEERWLFAGVIVLAANSGGAWSPIGDVTTIMLWMADKVTTTRLIVGLIVPCIVSVVVPVLIASRWVKEGKIMKVEHRDDTNRLAAEHPHLSRWILVSGVACLMFVPIFKTLTGLPPFMGMLLSLGVMWLLTEIVIGQLKIDKKLGGRVSQCIRNIDMTTIMFFLGILMSVSALSQVGILGSVAMAMNETIHEPYTIATSIGILSSVVDNVPLVSACIKMFNDISLMEPDYAVFFAEDGLFWHLLTFTAGVGGSLLIIGSAAGVVAMGIEKIEFFWYLKRISFIALLGYLAGIATIWLEYLLFPMM